MKSLSKIMCIRTVAFVVLGLLVSGVVESTIANREFASGVACDAMQCPVFIIIIFLKYFP